MLLFPCRVIIQAIQSLSHVSNGSTGVMSHWVAIAVFLLSFQLPSSTAPRAAGRPRRHLNSGDPGIEKFEPRDEFKLLRIHPI